MPIQGHTIKFHEVASYGPLINNTEVMTEKISSSEPRTSYHVEVP